ncbi:hypothetical protein NBRC116590_31850 [Pelagimonas sp. KU-00592-HH]
MDLNRFETNQERELKARMQILEEALAEYVQRYGWTAKTRELFLGGRIVRDCRSKDYTKTKPAI